MNQLHFGSEYGYLDAYSENGLVQVSMIVVYEAHRRQGHGTALVNRLKDAVRPSEKIITGYAEGLGTTSTKGARSFWRRQGAVFKRGSNRFYIRRY